MGYVGSITHHLSWNDPIDQPAPGPGNIQARRPFNAQYPNVTAIAYYESVGVGSYNSLQTSFQQQLSRGFFLTANYVWAHALDNAPYDGGVDGPYLRIQPIGTQTMLLPTTISITASTCTEPTSCHSVRKSLS